MQQIAAKDAVPGAELVAEPPQTAPVSAEVDANSGTRTVTDTPAKMDGVRIKDHYALTTQETWNLGHVIYGIEAEAEPTDLIGS